MREVGGDFTAPRANIDEAQIRPEALPVCTDQIGRLHLECIQDVLLRHEEVGPCVDAERVAPRLGLIEGLERRDRRAGTPRHTGQREGQHFRCLNWAKFLFKKNTLPLFIKC